MSVTKETIQAMFNQARSVFSGATETIRHDSRSFVGTRVPFEKGERIEEDGGGAVYTVTGGVRLATAELGRVWPKPGDTVDIKPPDGDAWLTYIVITTRLDEMQATMILMYGERYDQ